MHSLQDLSNERMFGSKVEVVASKQLQPLLDKLRGSTRRSVDFTQLCELQVSLRWVMVQNLSSTLKQYKHRVVMTIRSSHVHGAHCWNKAIKGHAWLSGHSRVNEPHLSVRLGLFIPFTAMQYLQIVVSENINTLFVSVYANKTASRSGVSATSRSCFSVFAI